jgi:hypothetical protein
MSGMLLSKKSWQIENENVLNVLDKKKKESELDLKEMDPSVIADKISDRMIKLIEKEFEKKKKAKK